MKPAECRNSRRPQCQKGPGHHKFKGRALSGRRDQEGPNPRCRKRQKPENGPKPRIEGRAMLRKPCTHLPRPLRLGRDGSPKPRVAKIGKERRKTTICPTKTSVRRNKRHYWQSIPARKMDRGRDLQPLKKWTRRLPCLLACGRYLPDCRSGGF